MTKNIFLLVLQALIVFIVMPTPVYAEDLFKGKRIKLIIPFKTGGGTDKWARYVASLLSEKLPDNPPILIENIVGQGSIKGANQFAESAKNGDLLMFASSASVMFPYLLGDKRVKYDYNDWQTLLVSPTGAIIYVSPTLLNEFGKITSDNEEQIRLLAQGPTQLNAILLLALELLDLDFEVSFGAGGAITTFNHYREGRTNMDMQTTASYKANVEELVREGVAVPLFSVGQVTADGKIIRDQNFPHLPHFIEYYQRRYKNEAPENNAYEAWLQLFHAGFPTQKMLLVHKDTDPEVLAAYQHAIDDVIKAIEGMSEQDKGILGDYEQFQGAVAQRLMQETLIIKPEVVTWYREWFEGKMDRSI